MGSLRATWPPDRTVPVQPLEYREMSAHALLIILYLWFFLSPIIGTLVGLCIQTED